MNKITLQINLAPGDYRHAKYILKHQLDVLSGQVNEILLVVDTRPAKGRFAEGWNEYRDQLDHFLIEEIEPFYAVKTIHVDYSGMTRSAVANFFFDRGDIPAKDFRGGPFYSYFFGLYLATNDLVFHLDSDMFLGGLSQSWISEALQFYNTDKRCFILSPLPGPPHPEDILFGQSVISKIAPHTYLLNGMSTRIFLIDKARFNTHKLILSKPAWRNQLKAIVQGNPNADLPEVLLSAYMARHDLSRIDFLGQKNGLWSLHPPYRTGNFYAGLPGLINRIESNDLPGSQQGLYDIIDEVCDWSEAKKQLKDNRWWKKLIR